jgi:hypothetical protein
VSGTILGGSYVAEGRVDERFAPLCDGTTAARYSGGADFRFSSRRNSSKVLCSSSRNGFASGGVASGGASIDGVAMGRVGTRIGGVGTIGGNGIIGDGVGVLAGVPVTTGVGVGVVAPSPPVGLGVAPAPKSVPIRPPTAGVAPAATCRSSIYARPSSSAFFRSCS